MASVEKLKTNLIDKILAIKSEDFLITLDNLVTKNQHSEEVMKLSPSQKKMIEMGLSDVKNENYISQEELDKNDLSWLNEK